MMDLLTRFRDTVQQQHLFLPKDKLIIAVSGGVDSVVLCELCKQAGFDFMIAHCNFQLRGEESERDEAFVIELGKKYGVETFVKRFDTDSYAAENKRSTQEAARELRYSWFGELVNSQWSIVNTANGEKSIDPPIVLSERRIGAPLTIHLLTAHHADDNNETLLMNFFRGTGLHGLTGIPEKTGMIRRPLLGFFKEELHEFAASHALSFVEDSSNQSSKYTRNYFRNEILPAIGKVYPQVKENLQDNISRFKEIERLYQLSVDGLKKKLCRVKGKEVHIPVRQLMGYQNRALIYELISPYGFQEKQVEEVIKLAGSDSGKYIQSPAAPWRLIKHRHWFIISPTETRESGIIIIEEGDTDIPFPLGTLHIERSSVLQPPAGSDLVTLDAGTIQFPLLLRRWKTGDYFYPLGMKKKKKLNRFLIDQKLAAPQKEKVWVIESRQRIIWVVGYRIDERFKLTDTTKMALRLRLIPSE